MFKRETVCVCVCEGESDTYVPSRHSSCFGACGLALGVECLWPAAAEREGNKLKHSNNHTADYERYLGR